MIPTAPFTPRVITMSQCPIRILDCRLNSRIPLFHWSLSQMRGVKGAVGIIFDISITMPECLKKISCFFKAKRNTSRTCFDWSIRTSQCVLTNEIT